MQAKWGTLARSSRSNSMRRHLLLACSARSAFAVCWAVPAFAQNVTPPPASAENTAGVGDIVVTAQRRAQNLQDVPVAVTAVTQEALQVNRVTNVNDLTSLAPGLLSRQNAGSLGSPSFSMRGVFASASAASQDREIPLYLDGVYLGTNRGSVFDLPDLERIEVLRGPQGTLFGRNATAGAISVVTRDPSGEFHARQEFTVGNYAQFRSRTTIDTPQFGPFSAYFTYVHDERRGDVRNIGAGTAFDYSGSSTKYGVRTSPKYLGDRDANNFFAAVKFEPSDRLKMIYKYDRSHATNSPDARVTQVINPNDLVGGLLTAAIQLQPAGGGVFGPVTLDPENKRPDAANNAWSQGGFVKTYGHNLTTTFQASDDLSFKNITAYRRSSAYGPSTIAGLSGLEYTAALKQFYQQPRFNFGLPSLLSYANIFDQTRGGNEPVGSYFAGYEGNSFGRSHQFSSETQANYQSKLLTLTVGALYYRSYEFEGGLPGLAPNFSFEPIPGNVIPTPLAIPAFGIAQNGLQDSFSRTTSLSAYGQAELHLTPQLDIVGGVRVTRDKKHGALISGGNYNPVTDMVTGTTSDTFRFKVTKPSFSIGANYKPNSDILLYGKYSTAFLSGGAVGEISFRPETVASEELGIKSEFLDRRLRVNVAVYNAVYHHQQASQSGSVIKDTNPADNAAGITTFQRLGVVVIDNGTLKSRGIEAEVTVAPTEGVTLGGSAAYTYARLKNPNPLLFTVPGQTTYRQTGVAPWIGQVYGQYQTRPLFGDAVGFFRLDANYQGRYRALPDPGIATHIPVFAPYEFVKARWVLNGRLALRDIKLGRLDSEVAIWARNLTNNKDALYELQFGTFQINSSYQPGRTFGADFIVNFR